MSEGAPSNNQILDDLQDFYEGHLHAQGESAVGGLHTGTYNYAKDLVADGLKDGFWRVAVISAIAFGGARNNVNARRLVALGEVDV